MITVLLPDTFVAERRYMIDVFLGEHFSLDYRVVVRKSSAVYIQLENGSQLEIQDHFFSQLSEKEGYLHEKAFPQKNLRVKNPFTSETDAVLLYGNESFSISRKTISCGMDLIASAFFMLSRFEEHVYQKKKAVLQFPAKESVAAKFAFLHRPIVDEYAEMLWNMLVYLGFEGNRKKTKMKWYITHDVENPLKWRRLRDLLDAVSTGLLRDLRPGKAIKDLGSYLGTKMRIKKDPFDSFDEIMSLSERLNLRSEFYLMAADEGEDSQAQFLSKLMQKIDARGHLIGFCPSQSTLMDPFLWKKELAYLQRLSPQEITVGRQQKLAFSVPYSWELWDDAGMRVDSSMGYSKSGAFRAGTCRDYPVFNILKRKMLRLYERPLLLSESALLWEKGDALQIHKKILLLLGKVRKYAGSFVMNWKNSSLHDSRHQSYKSLYYDILKEGAK